MRSACACASWRRSSYDSIGVCSNSTAKGGGVAVPDSCTFLFELAQTRSGFLDFFHYPLIQEFNILITDG